ncbi:conserved hypothetical protein [Chloroherpeton thalassium ATCC 35110]|uniref:Uncharacterized protein n=1 Tax=Chloroherpeton thalassium (strain ATCC 35110 / GB-78) TaxID=517418 RepID=B3QZC1_CHLT3|nr:hypothetical protein [Chloroherpeton thalassium]ACF13814.1 conserved hypothetical protein [Chloroherpeton thalassium ATCC 35110]
MNPICIDNYCFDRIHLWIQYSPKQPRFTEFVIEVYYPKNLDAKGLIMFDHGFLIGQGLFYYPKLLLGALFNDYPLFAQNPSHFYNYTTAAVKHNWAMAFVTSSHFASELIPWIDFGGNPRVGQEAYAAASYLIRHGVTNFFRYKPAEERTKFMKTNNVVFAGHSVGGAHAQAAAVGFEQLHCIGESSGLDFNPIIYNRELLPAHTQRFSDWKPEDLANPVGLVQLSPVDMTNAFLKMGMASYREALSKMNMPMVMVFGQCDCAALQQSNPPAWSSDPNTETEFSQLAPQNSDSWAVAANVEKGSHCGYLTANNELCDQADAKYSCKLCPDVDVYKSNGPETAFTIDLFDQFLGLYPNGSKFDKDFCGWMKSDFIKWLDKKSPDGNVNLVPFADGRYIDYANKSRCK